MIFSNNRGELFNRPNIWSHILTYKRFSRWFSGTFIWNILLWYLSGIFHAMNWSWQQRESVRTTSGDALGFEAVTAETSPYRSLSKRWAALQYYGSIHKQREQAVVVWVILNNHRLYMNTSNHRRDINFALAFNLTWPKTRGIKKLLMVGPANGC